MARAKRNNIPDDEKRELIELRLDLIDRLTLDITVQDIYGYEEELRALVNFPSNERGERLNQLVQKIKKQYKARAVK